MKVIKSGSYDKSELLEKLDVFLLNNRLTQSEYEALLKELLKEVTEDSNLS